MLMLCVLYREPIKTRHNGRHHSNPDCKGRLFKPVLSRTQFTRPKMENGRKKTFPEKILRHILETATQILCYVHTVPIYLNVCVLISVSRAASPWIISSPTPENITFSLSVKAHMLPHNSGDISAARNSHCLSCCPFDFCLFPPLSQSLFLLCSFRTFTSPPSVSMGAPRLCSSLHLHNSTLVGA